MDLTSLSGENVNILRREAIYEGMSTLFGDGMRKVFEGITTFEEVKRVTKISEHEEFAVANTFEDYYA